MNIVFPQTNPTSPGDRLGFAVVLALALHALLIFGVGFRFHQKAQPAPTFEVTLAHHQSREAPDDPDYLARFDQQGSGSKKRQREITTDRLPELESSELRKTQPLTPPPMQKRQSEARPVISALSPEGPALEDQKDKLDGLVQDTPFTPRERQEVASLRAKLDRQQQEYGKLPRVLRLTEASTKAAAEAEYLRQWVEWVEEIGNRNYPREASEKHIFGDLSLAVTIERDGSVAGVEILHSSGERVLDQAAVRIVRLAAPFAPIPPGIKQDRVEIIRTWRFIPGNQFASKSPG